MTGQIAPQSGRTRRAVVDTVIDGAEVEVTGPICARTSAQVRSCLNRAIAQGEGDLVVHLAGAEVWDATGLGVIVGAHDRAARCGRRLVVADASARLCRLIRGTGLARVLVVQDELPRYVPLALTA